MLKARVRVPRPGRVTGVFVGRGYRYSHRSFCGAAVELLAAFVVHHHSRQSGGVSVSLSVCAKVRDGGGTMEARARVRQLMELESVDVEQAPLQDSSKHRAPSGSVPPRSRCRSCWSRFVSVCVLLRRIILLLPVALVTALVYMYWYTFVFVFQTSRYQVMMSAACPYRFISLLSVNFRDFLTRFGRFLPLPGCSGSSSSLWRLYYA